uniref:Non-canonical E2 ubiquitin-conjugating enzyme C-terminal domain-containing protein n=1 Tax=Chaetoceros debilis TaxID=122233 RepID=A0A7S3VBU6_9STRA
MSNPAQPSHVSSANYPIAQPLATILKVAIDGQKQQPQQQPQVNQVDVESKEDALQHFIRNSFVAMDDMYFATPPSHRNKESFQHRLAIRISTNEANKTLTITDYGSGMTRSDLINSLVGSRLSSKAIAAARALDVKSTSQSNSKDEEEEGESSSDSEDESSTDDTNSDDDDDDDESSEDGTGLGIHRKSQQNSSDGSGNDNGNGNGSSNNPHRVPCQADDIGGFYAALCALGEQVEIGTKSKHDDYYIFKLPADGNSNDNGGDGSNSTNSNKFSQFSISRPMEEGVKPTPTTGFSSFTDVRGDSGTKLTITLNQSSIDAGFLKEEEVLKPLLGKFLQASPYTVVLDHCCTDVERKDVIHASQREMEELEAAATAKEAQDDDENDDNGGEDMELLDGEGKSTETGGSYNSVKERAKYIPLRLSMGERKMLRLVEAAMACCDYTTETDKPFKSSTRRTHAQMKHISSVLRGMVTACDYAAGQILLEEDNYSEYAKFFRQMFEIARRHKIMNPEKMRTEYGKLIYLLQDAVSPSIQPHLAFSCKGEIETVYKYLEENGGVKMLEDPLIEVATREVLAGKKSRSQISNEIRRKERAVAHLKQHYRSQHLSSENIHLCLYSICDNDSFLNSNRVPVDKVIGYLEQFFSPTKIEEGYSLSIVSGQDGSRLSHSHERQYYFALQSLTLWRDIIDDMFRLWAMAESDLLSESVSYALQDTGQGFQRVQQSPQTYKSMQKILSRVQGKVKQWIGSNVIHLGDHNVPNSLTFIDKYTQVPRILSPIVTCLENVEKICEEDNGVKAFIDNGFGGVEQLRKGILYDFFKSAFDGSGADNFYDAGSCIDGRLTSAWNWCSQLQDKPFYCIFKLTGFTGFDGEFK